MFKRLFAALAVTALAVVALRVGAVLGDIDHAHHQCEHCGTVKPIKVKPPRRDPGGPGMTGLAALTAVATPAALATPGRSRAAQTQPRPDPATIDRVVDLWRAAGWMA